MKFLLFNAAVIAALVYLFNADRGDFREAADRIYDTAEEAGDLTRRVVRKIEEASPAPTGASQERRVPVMAPEAPPPAAAPAPEPQEVKAPAPVTAPARELAREAATPAPAASPVAEPPPTRAMAPVPLLPARPKPAAPPPAASVAAQAPPSDDLSPAVAQRRKEVLEGLPAGEAGAPIALAEGEELMSPEQRVRELYSLAEEMEMLYVNKMAR